MSLPEKTPTESVRCADTEKRASWSLLAGEAKVIGLYVAGMFTFMEGGNLVLDWLFPTPSHAAFVEHRLGWRLFYAAALFLTGVVTMRLAAREQKAVTQQRKHLKYLRWKAQQIDQGTSPEHAPTSRTA